MKMMSRRRTRTRKRRTMLPFLLVLLMLAILWLTVFARTPGYQSGTGAASLICIRCLRWHASHPPRILPQLAGKEDAAWRSRGSATIGARAPGTRAWRPRQPSGAGSVPLPSCPARPRSSFRSAPCTLRAGRAAVPRASAGVLPTAEQLDQTSLDARCTNGHSWTGWGEVTGVCAGGKADTSKSQLVNGPAQDHGL